jgi:DNA polymerase-3 subunit delta'
MRPMDRETWPPAEGHAHAAAVLGPAARNASPPSHSYLFHGPAGAGKRALAREFAAALLADGATNAATVAERVRRETHPDLTWVRASGAAEMLVGDIDEPVVAAANMTPFESARRVFVIEGAERMNDQAANRLLKTLEEPPPFAHLVLITDRLQDVLPTIASRCQRVRFDPPPAAAIEAGLLAGQGVDPERARACARLALGDAGLARALAGEGGTALRAAAETFVRTSLAGDTAGAPWKGLLEAARGAGALAGAQAEQRVQDELELIPSKERKRHQREGAEAQRRVERRARTETLELGLRLAELWLRDLLCLQLDAAELIHAVDRRGQLETDAGRVPVDALARAIELVGSTRLSLAVNVSEELALEALAYELAELGRGEAG